MRRNWSFTRNWAKNSTLFKRTYWSFLNFFLFSIIGIFSFAYYETRDSRWIVFIVFASIALVFISWKWFIGLLIFIPSLFLCFSLINNSKAITEISGNYRISQVISSGYIINKDYQKILLKTKSVLNIDDLINIKTTNLESLKSKKEQYDYYLKSLGIKYVANNPLISKVNNETSIRAKILNYLQDGPNFYVNYISLILLGKKNDLNKDLYEKVKYISILHLFVISGFHINLIMIIILWICKKMKINSKYSNLIGFIIVSFYLYILNFPISSLRAILFLFLCFINKEFLKNKFGKIDILSFVMLSIFIWNPFVIFSLSFILTFLITFSILFVSDTKNKKVKIPIIILFSYLSSVIILINVNGWINVFGIINSIVFSPIIVINYVISIFGFPFKNPLNSYFIFIDKIIELFYKNSLIINTSINDTFIDWYYLSFFLVISSIKHYNIIANVNRSLSSRNFLLTK